MLRDQERGKVIKRVWAEADKDLVLILAEGKLRWFLSQFIVLVFDSMITPLAYIVTCDFLALNFLLL